MTYLQTAADFIHHRPSTAGAHTACMYEAGTMTTSTSWGMVTCPACIQNHATPKQPCPACEGYGDPDPDGCPRCGKRGFRG